MPCGSSSCIHFSFGIALISLPEHKWNGLPPEREVNSTVDTEMVQKVATKIKHAADPSSVLLSNIGKTALVGTKSLS